jgi:hypothetical protein
VTAAEIGARALKRIDDDASHGAGSMLAGEIIAAINEGCELAAWLTLCLETTLPIILPAATSVVQLRALVGDFLVPLKLEVAGTRLRPSTLAGLDASNSQWLGAAGTPTRYSTLGFNLLFLDSQPAFDTGATLTYARTPVQLVGDSWPELPEVYHPALIDYVVYRVRIKEGAQGLQRGVSALNRFLDDMTKFGDFVRARSRAARLDIEPFELHLFDRSRLA